MGYLTTAMLYDQQKAFMVELSIIVHTQKFLCLQNLNLSA